MLSNVIDIRDRVSEKLDGTVTIKKRVVVVLLVVIPLFFVSLSAFSPFWVRRGLRLNTNVVWLPDDPGQKMKWAVHSETQDEALFKMKCQELGVTYPPKAVPNARRARRPRR